MPQLHLPVQSGSDRMLEAMNRRHTRADYLDVVARCLKARPDLALTSDFIVGFPGETEDDFAETLSLIDEIGFSGAFSFKYSPRPGTQGADMGDQIDEDKNRPPAPAAGGDRSKPGGVQPKLRRPQFRGAVRARGPPSRPDRRPLALSPAGTDRSAGFADRRDCRRHHHRVASNSLFGTLAQQPTRHRPTCMTLVGTGA